MSQICTLSATGESLAVPAWTRIKQSFDQTAIDDVPSAVKEAMVCTALHSICRCPLLDGCVCVCVCVC
eukprot:COSAG02_NODE_17982_length_967_cov_2.102535_1_plen_67_part_10